MPLGVIEVMTPKPLTYLTLGLATLFLALPLILAVFVALSLQDPSYAPLHGADLSQMSFDNIAEAFTRGHAGTCFVNSLFIAGASALMGVVVGFPTAYVLARYHLPWKGAILGLLLLLRLQPKMPAMAGYYHMVTLFGLLDNPISIVLVRGGGIVLAIWLMKAAIESIPVSLEQVALVDGFTPWQVATRITLPLCLPAVSAAFLLEFASSWNTFLLPLLFLSSESRMTVAVGIDRFLSGNAVQPELVMAFAVIVSLPLVIVFPWLFALTLAPYRRRMIEKRLS